MSVYFNAASAERFVSPTTLSLSTSSVTFCGRLVAGGTGGTAVEARIGAGTTAIQFGPDGAGNFNVYNGASSQALAEPSAGTVYFWYVKLAGSGAGNVTFGVHPVGGSLTTGSHALVNTGTIDRMWVGGDPFDPCDVKLDSFKVFNSLLSAGDLVNERGTFEPWQASYIWLPMTAGTVAACALDSSGNARDFTVSGSPAIITTPAGGHVLTCASGSFTRSGQTAGLVRGRPMVAAFGSFTRTGQSAGLAFARKLVAVQGSYSLSGQPATLSYSGAAVRTLTATQGAFALSGQAAALRAARKIAAAQGSFTRTGQTAALRVGRALVCATGSYALSGKAATLIFVRRLRLSAESGAFLFTGQTARLAPNDRSIIAEPLLSETHAAAPIAGRSLTAAAIGGRSIIAEPIQ